MPDAVSVADQLRHVVERLAAAGVPTPETDAQLLVRHVTGWSGSQLRRSHGESLAPAQAAALEALVGRRASREPLQLLVGSVGFRYIDIEVRRGVFIPRPETEVLAGEAIARVPGGGVVIEPCTGTGAVACTVSLESEAREVLATDVDPDAVALATSNVARTGASVQVLQGDLLEPVPQRHRGGIDVLVANPPYLAQGELAAAEPEVVEWDPQLALVSGPTGHEVVDRILDASVTWLRPGGWVLLEVDARRAHSVAARATTVGLTEATVIQDLTGADRIVAARRRS